MGEAERPGSVGALFIDGAWGRGAAGRTEQVLDPADQSVLAEVPVAEPADVDRAVRAARTAFDGPWRGTTAAQRADLLTRVAALLVRDKEQVARVETQDTGKTLVEARLDVDDVVAVLRYYAALVVTGGDRLVVKPSEVAPLPTVRLVALLEEAGAPAGVVNLVLGGGPVGAALSAHDDVDLVSFTGGIETGRAVLRAGAETVKRVLVELGGKNPDLVFADSDLDVVVDNALTAALHSGQVCSAGARLIVQDEVYDEVVAGVAAGAEQIVLGGGLDPATECGPLVSAAQRDRVERYVASALAEGARLVAGGRRPDDPGLQAGLFYRPTVFAGCSRDMTVVREEVFGPVLTVERSAQSRRRSTWATTPTTAWPARCGRPTPGGRTGWPGPCGTGRSG